MSNPNPGLKNKKPKQQKEHRERRQQEHDSKQQQQKPNEPDGGGESKPAFVLSLEEQLKGFADLLIDLYLQTQQTATTHEKDGDQNK